jgi:hypothetical protein
MRRRMVVGSKLPYFQLRFIEEVPGTFPFPDKPAKDHNGAVKEIPFNSSETAEPFVVHRSKF